MKLAFTTLACPNWSIEQVIDAAKRYGYEGLEMRLLDGEVITSDLDTETRLNVRALCNEAGLPIMCLDTSVRIAQPDPAAREAQVREGLKMLDLAAEWEAPSIRVFGGPPAGASRAEALAGAIECLAPLVERGRQLGVTVALETHDAFPSGELVMQVLEQLPGAGVIWDTLHPCRAGETVDETLHLLRDRLVHVHIKDGRPPAGAVADATQPPAWDLTLLGEGEVPVRVILEGLRSIGYTGWLSVEWEKKWHPEIPDPEIALPQFAHTLRTYLASL